MFCGERNTIFHIIYIRHKTLTCRLHYSCRRPWMDRISRKSPFCPVYWHKTALSHCPTKKQQKVMNLFYGGWTQKLQCMEHFNNNAERKQIQTLSSNSLGKTGGSLKLDLVDTKPQKQEIRKKTSNEVCTKTRGLDFCSVQQLKKAM